MAGKNEAARAVVTAALACVRFLGRDGAGVVGSKEAYAEAAMTNLPEIGQFGTRWQPGQEKEY